MIRNEDRNKLNDVMLYKFQSLRDDKVRNTFDRAHTRERKALQRGHRRRQYEFESIFVGETHSERKLEPKT